MPSLSKSSAFSLTTFGLLPEANDFYEIEGAIGAIYYAVYDVAIVLSVGFLVTLGGCLKSTGDLTDLGTIGTDIVTGFAASSISFLTCDLSSLQTI